MPYSYSFIDRHIDTEDEHDKVTTVPHKRVMPYDISERASREALMLCSNITFGENSRDMGVVCWYCMIGKSSSG